MITLRVRLRRALCVVAVSLCSAWGFSCDARLGSSGDVSVVDGAISGLDSLPTPLPDATPTNTSDAAPPPDAATPCVEGDGRLVGGTTGSCYIYYATPRDWNQARAACEAIGAHLVVSTSQAENDDFSLLAGMLDVWVGGTDSNAEGVWLWINGELMSYTNWRTGEPNNNDPNDANGEDCMIIEGDNGGLWDDRSCLKTFGYICERE